MGFLKLAFLISLISLNDSQYVDKSREMFKVASGLHGHCGYFKQNFSDYPIDNPLGYQVIINNAIKFMFIKPDTVIRFMAVRGNPHLTIKRDDNGFTIGGPHFSVVMEAAKLVNYR